MKSSSTYSVFAIAFTLLVSSQSIEAPRTGPGGTCGPPMTANFTVFDGKLLDGDAAPEISTTELLVALKDRRVVLLDARPYEEFAKGHIPEARSVPGLPGLPASKYTADAGEVKKMVPDPSRPLVLYCNGLHCGRSKRFAAELRKVGYTNARRYQLGIPAWRALGGVTQIEKDALVALLEADTTAVLVDARDSSTASPTLARARWIPVSEAPKAKDDGRLPMTDHNTRIFVVGENAAQARAAAEAIVHDAFHNVSFYGGTIGDLSALHEGRRN